MTTDRARDTTGRASAPDLPDSKLTNFDDPNSSKRALSAASSACLYSSFSRKEPKIGQFSSVYLLQISWRLSLTLFQEIFFLLAVITFHLYDGGHTDLVHLVRISVLAGNFSSPSAVAKLSIRAADLKLRMRKMSIFDWSFLPDYRLRHRRSLFLWTGQSCSRETWKLGILLWGNRRHWWRSFQTSRDQQNTWGTFVKWVIDP